MTTKHKVLVSIAVVSFLAGVAGQYFYPGQEVTPVDLWVIPVFALLIFWWYRLDTAQLGYKRTPWLNVAVIAIAALALPYYFFRSRGFKRGALATFALLGALVVSGFLTFVGQCATYFGLQS